MKKYIEAWEEAMRFGLMAGRPYSEVCIKTYKLYVQHFLDEYGDISIENYKKTLLKIPIEHFAKRLKLYEALNCFVRFLAQENLMEESYLTEVKRYKPRRHLPPKKTTVDQKGIQKLLEVCSKPLDRLLIILLSQTGLRVSEAASLKLNDVDLEKKILTVRIAKWGKTRRVGLSEEVVIAIKEYLPERPKASKEWLMLNSRKEQINRYGIRTRLEKLGQQAKVPVTPHALRRAFVTINVNKGRPLVMLQIACGHSDITTTRSYCMTTEDETIEAMQGWN